LDETLDDSHSLEELEKAIHSLTDEEWLDIYDSARQLVFHYPQIDPQEVVDEAITRMLEGVRNWKRGVAFGAFFFNAMRSIAHDFRKAVKRRWLEEVPIASDGREGEAETIEISDGQGDIADQLHATRIIERIHAHFEPDLAAIHYLAGLAEGYTAKEVQEIHCLSAAEYEAARKRCQRWLAQEFLKAR
jgi:DNA-directed RNA polymerase specialized sigma24 family protein